MRISPSPLADLLLRLAWAFSPIIAALLEAVAYWLLAGVPFYR